MQYKSLNDIISQHFDSVGELFSDYKITAPVTAENLAACIHKFGDDFAEDLEHLCTLDFCGFKDKATRDATKAAKKEKRDAKKAGKKAGKEGKVAGTGAGKSKFVEFLKGSAGDILGGLVGGIGAAVKGKQSPTEDGPAGDERPPLTGKEKEAAEKKAKETKNHWIYGGIGLGFLALIVTVLLATGGKKVV